MGYISTVTSIPKMTSNTVPSGVANASTNHSTSQSYFAFDQNYASTSSAWTTNAVTTGWISYQFTRQLFIGKYAIYPQQSALTRAPKNWTFEGSNDGTTWTILDTQSNVTTWVNSTRKEFIVLSPKLFNTYRLNITANNGDSQYLSIGEFEMFELTYAYKFLISSEDKYYSVRQIDSPFIIARASSNVSNSFLPEYAINSNIKSDNSSSSRWSTALLSVDPEPWFMIEFAKPLEVDKIRFLQFRGNINSSTYDRIKDCIVEFSDGTSISLTLPDRYVDVNQTISDSVWSLIEFSSRKTKFIRLKKISSYEGNVRYTSFIEFEAFFKGEKIKRDSVHEGSLYQLPNSSEHTFIRYGMDKGEPIDMVTTETKERIYAIQDNAIVGSGKVFKQKIDTTKTPIRKASVT
ncbi:MAG TPA: hypothetical protein DEF35_20800 [Paenibacillus sp.]|uniref:discoidin domain-containing protein n=1 Tax=Paenibacillus TaxID=44249 RepID=UPI000BA0465B|nr:MULTISPECIES: discoidin domain-containing protein [Paenibacillus]OZQ73109.1 hypothetical protein CA599_04515 [Paenibacillus taichungensis]HBU84057.1 hypothetical protein [Paenibacillus sp.]